MFTAEYSSGRIALLRVYDSVLNEGEVSDLYSQLSPVPEPASLVLVGPGIVGMVAVGRRWK